MPRDLKSKEDILKIVSIWLDRQTEKRTGSQLTITPTGEVSGKDYYVGFQVGISETHTERVFVLRQDN
jgi:hypothetical protein